MPLGSAIRVSSSSVNEVEEIACESGFKLVEDFIARPEYQAALAEGKSPAVAAQKTQLCLQVDLALLRYLIEKDGLK